MKVRNRRPQGSSRSRNCLWFGPTKSRPASSDLIYFAIGNGSRNCFGGDSHRARLVRAPNRVGAEEHMEVLALARLPGHVTIPSSKPESVQAFVTWRLGRDDKPSLLANGAAFPYSANIAATVALGASGSIAHAWEWNVSLGHRTPIWFQSEASAVSMRGSRASIAFATLSWIAG